MNPYAMQDSDREWIINQQEMDDACVDYIREAFDDVPDRCDPRCPWKDPWLNCVHGDKWPNCKLGDHFVAEGLM